MKKKLLFAVPIALVSVLALAYGVIYFRVKQLIDAQLAELVVSGVYEKAEYESLHLSPLGKLQMANLHLQQPDAGIIINTVTVSDVDLLHEVPWHLQVAIDGIRFPAGLPDLSGTGNPLLQSLLDDLVNNDTLQLHVEYSYRYDPAQSDQMISASTLALPGYFELTGESETLNIPLGSFAAISAADPDAAAVLQAELLKTAALPRASLRLQDSGLIDALVSVMAEGSGIPPAAMRSQLKSQLQNYYLFLPATMRGIAQQTGNQLAEFIDGGRTLTLTVAPAFGGELAQLQPELMGTVLIGNFDKAVELLQFKIAVE